MPIHDQKKKKSILFYLGNAAIKIIIYAGGELNHENCKRRSKFRNQTHSNFAGSKSLTRCPSTMCFSID